MPLSEQDLLCLFEATRAIASTLRLSELLKTIMRLASEVVRAEASSLLLYDPVTGDLYFNVALGEKKDALDPIRLKKGEGIAGWVADHKKPAVVNDVSKDARWTARADHATQFKTRSVLAVPMQIHFKLVGVMEVINRSDGALFNETDVQLLEIFAAQAAVMIENARLFESLQMEKEKISTVFEEMKDGALLLATSGEVLLANPAAQHLLGQETFVGHWWAEIENTFEVTPSWKTISAKFPKNLSEIPSPLVGEGGGGGSAATSITPIPTFPHQGGRGSENAKEEQKGGAQDLELQRKAPPLLWLAGTLTPIRNDRVQIAGYVVAFRDVTEERRESLLKKDFLSLVSHKLRTPLVSIRGYTPLLLEKPDQLTPFQQKALRSIDKSSEQLTNLVGKLVSFATMESETIKLLCEPKSLKELIQRATTDLSSLLVAQKVDMVCDPSLDTLPWVRVDAEKIKEVLRDLIENAVKFNASSRPRVRISGKAIDSERVELSVEDNGPGIPPEEQSKIFQKFYQIEQNFTGQVQGMGLGLAVVKRLVEAHGGDVRVQSTLGQGSTFTIVLPVS